MTTTKTKKLTPVYAVFYDMPNISGHKTFTLQSGEFDDFGGSITLSGSSKKMITVAEKFVESHPDYPVWVRQYGYKERGLLPTERVSNEKIFEYLPIENINLKEIKL